MRLFNRNRDTTISELENYYSNRGSRMGAAWAMALISLLVTVAVIAALFFGGRWIYRTLSKNDDKKTVATVETVSYNDIEDRSSAPTTDPSSESYSEVVSSEAASTDVSSVDRAASSAGTTVGASTAAAAPSLPATTPRSGDSTIPNTGAGEVLLIAPFIAAIAGYFISRKAQLKP